MEKKRLAQIVVPALVLIIIALLWWMKNSQRRPVADDYWSSLEITTVDLEEIKGKGLPVMINFSSDSCFFCRQMEPALEKIYEELRGKAVIHSINVWKHPGAARGFPVQAVPTQIFYTADGEPYRPGAELAKEIPFILYKKKDTGEHVFTVHEGALTEDEMRTIFMDMGVRE